MSLLNMLRALRYGAELTNAEAWKTRATAIAAVTGLLSAVTGFAAAQGWLEAIDPQTIMEVASALVTIVSAVLAYFQVATSGRVGVGKNQDREVDPAPLPFPEASAPRSGDRRLEPEPDRLRYAPGHAEPARVPPAPERLDERPGQRPDDNPFLFS